MSQEYFSKPAGHRFQLDSISIYTCCDIYETDSQSKDEQDQIAYLTSSVDMNSIYGNKIYLKILIKCKDTSVRASILNRMFYEKQIQKLA